MHPPRGPKGRGVAPIGCICIFGPFHYDVYGYQARAGFSRIKKIPYQAPPKMYILEKRIFGTQISMLGFFIFLENLKNYHAQLF